MRVKSCALRTRDIGVKEHKLEIRKDDVANALTSVAKDSLVIEIIGGESAKESDTMTNIERKEERPVNTQPFRYVSLFSGIGGFEQALNTLGGERLLPLLDA